MSLILDALRKLELERKARRQGTQPLRAEVLNYHGAVPVAEKNLPRTIAVAALMAVCLSAAGIVFLARQDSPKSESMSPVVRQNQNPLPVAPPVALPLTAQQDQRGALPVSSNTVVVPVRTPEKKAEIQKNSEEGITVSGIAWQDERALRRAVINGALVGEGAEILGATVVEIRENRVRFSRGGVVFEVEHMSGTGR